MPVRKRVCCRLPLLIPTEMYVSLKLFDYYFDLQRPDSIFSQSLHYSLFSTGQNRREGRNSNLSST
jgi:hypothetical protein